MSYLLRQLIREHLLFLFEGRKDDVIKRFPDVDVEALSKQDPSGTRLAYLQWMAREIDKGCEIDEVVSVVKFFDKNKEKIRKNLGDKPNIEQWDAKELKTKIDSMGEFGPSKRSQRQKARTDAPKIAETDDLLLLRIDSKAASVQYGHDTRWCISMADEDHYNDYKKHNVLFYFVFRKKPVGRDPYDKVAVAVQRDKSNAPMQIDIFNSLDDKDDRRFVESKLSGFDKLFEKIKSDSTSQPKPIYAKIIFKEYVTNQQLINCWEEATAENNIDTKIIIIDRLKDYSPTQLKVILQHEKVEEIRDVISGKSDYFDGVFVYYDSKSLLHRDGDKPAKFSAKGNYQMWYQHGKRHREGDQPAVITIDGLKAWMINDQYHRDGDQPAVIAGNGAKEWYQHGQRHRDGDQPAVIDREGTKEWWVDGGRHREDDQPAVIYAEGGKEWWYNGKRHRENDQPAMIASDGRKEWWVHGRYHREDDKPAIEYADGSKAYYEYGKFKYIKKDDKITLR